MTEQQREWLRIISFLIACGAAFLWLFPIFFFLDFSILGNLFIGLSMIAMAVFNLCFEDRLETRLVALSAWLLAAGYLLYVLDAVGAASYNMTTVVMGGPRSHMPFLLSPRGRGAQAPGRQPL